MFDYVDVMSLQEPVDDVMEMLIQSATAKNRFRKISKSILGRYKPNRTEQGLEGQNFEASLKNARDCQNLHAKIRVLLMKSRQKNLLTILLRSKLPKLQTSWTMAD